MNQAQLAQIVAAVVAVMAAQSKPKASGHKAVSSFKPANKFTPKGKIASDGKTARQLANEVAVAKAFKKLGMNVTPRVDVFTFKQWELKGMRPNSKGTFVKGVGTLFHSGQVSPIKEISLITGQPVEASLGG